MYNFDLGLSKKEIFVSLEKNFLFVGYVQGMNDLLSPLLVVMEDEIDSFWCFAGLMERMHENFHLEQNHIKKQLANLHILLQFVDAELANYLGWRKQTLLNDKSN